MPIITHFPEYIITLANTEPKGATLLDTEEGKSLDTFFSVLQLAGLYDALAYCEKYFSWGNLDELTPNDFEIFIKNVHKHLAHGLISLNDPAATAGNYTTVRTLVVQEGYECTLKFSEYNYQAVKTNFGQQAGMIIKTFVKN